MNGAESRSRQEDTRSLSKRESRSTDDPLVAGLREAYAQLKMAGRDFARIDKPLISDGPWWDLEEDCQSAMSRAKRILDLGTGGGERLLRFLEQIGTRGKSIAAMEGWKPNLPVARKSLSVRSCEVVRYGAKRDGEMSFPDIHFDHVMSRHEAMDAINVARVLAPGGKLLTQQVDGYEVKETHEWFDERYMYPHVAAGQHIEGLEVAGFCVDVWADWQGATEFTVTGSVGDTRYPECQDTVRVGVGE